jgi:hypothetical protein
MAWLITDIGRQMIINILKKISRFTPCFFKTNFNTTPPSPSTSPKVFSCLHIFWREFFIHRLILSSLPCIVMSHPFRIPRFYCPNNIWWSAQRWNSLLHHFLELSIVLCLLGRHILFCTPLSNSLMCKTASMWETNSCNYIKQHVELQFWIFLLVQIGALYVASYCRNFMYSNEQQNRPTSMRLCNI